MAKIIVSTDGVVIREVELTKERITLGRRPYNDVVIDNLAVSGEHAAFIQSGKDFVVEDLGSTNGSYLNGKTLKRETLKTDDTLEIGKYKIKFVGDAPSATQNLDATMIIRRPTAAPAPMAAPVAAAMPAAAAVPAAAPAAVSGGPVVRVISGPAAGRDVPLTKIVTTIGKPGVAVAAITKRMAGFVVAHVDGAEPTLLNGAPLSAEAQPIKHGDMLELAGAQMQFVAG